MVALRVGLIGLGEVAQSIHLPVLADLRHLFRVSGLYDISPALRALCGARHAQATVFDSAEALIASPEIDAVFVLSSDETHHRFTRAAIQAGKHVLLEKPACLTVREIDDLLAVARWTSRIVFVAYMRRYAPAFLAAKAALPALGAITHARIFDLISEGRFFLRHAQDVLYPDDIDAAVLAAGAREREALLREVVGRDAPADLLRAYRGLTALSSHHISAMRELLGEPQGVLAAHRTNGGANTTVMFDYGEYVCNYDAVVDELGVFDAMIEVRANRGRLRILYDTPYIRSLPTRLEIMETGEQGPATRSIGPLYTDAFANELRAFHRHVMDGTPPKTDLLDSRRDLALMAQIIEKMRGMAQSAGQ